MIEAAVLRVDQQGLRVPRPVGEAQVVLGPRDVTIAALGGFRDAIDAHGGPGGEVVADVADPQPAPAAGSWSHRNGLGVPRRRSRKGERRHGATALVDAVDPRLVAAVVHGPEHPGKGRARRQTARLRDPRVPDREHPGRVLVPVPRRGRHRPGTHHRHRNDHAARCHDEEPAGADPHAGPSTGASSSASSTSRRGSTCHCVVSAR